MKADYYDRQWEGICSTGNPGQIQSLAQRIATNFLERYFYCDEYQAGHITLLCRMATFFQDPALNQISAKVLFGVVIERLCDDFEELQTETYNRLICQITGFLRNLPQGEELNAELQRQGIADDLRLYQRIESMRLNPDLALPVGLRPEKVIVLSRITIGADVAITTVICQRIRHRFPDAQIVVFGDAKLKQLFAAASGVEVRELHYSRRGGLLERFKVWLTVIDSIRAETAGLESDRFVVLDPDSRLTQLGVLPLVPDSAYRFFNSRGKTGYPPKASISELTNIWLDRILLTADFCYPRIWPESAVLERASAFIQRHWQGQRVITLNFGVGGNHRKQVSALFETMLVLDLLAHPGTRLVLDMGFGAEEVDRNTAILLAAENQGFRTAQIHFDQLPEICADHALVGLHSSVGEIAAMIQGSDEFIGYDSACQHIAAALGVKTCTVFAGTNNVRFIRRWHACGVNTSEILFVDTLSRDVEINEVELVRQLQDLRIS